MLNSDKLNEKHSVAEPKPVCLKPIKVSNFHLRIPFNSCEPKILTTTTTTMATIATTMMGCNYAFILISFNFFPSPFSADEIFSGNEVNRCFILTVFSRFRFSAEPKNLSF